MSLFAAKLDALVFEVNQNCFIFVIMLELFSFKMKI